MKKYDELINKYLDNELNLAEVNNINDLIKEDADFKLNFATHKYVHENLIDLPVHSVSDNFAEKLMSRILSSISVKYKKSYFFRGIISVLTVMLFVILFLFFFYALNLPVVKNSITGLEESQNLLKPFLIKFKQVLSTNIFKTVSAAIGFIILLGFYFTFNSFKDFRNRINQL